MNESIGLDPSVYGGGGSPSSTARFDASPFVSGGKATFVSAATFDSGSSSAKASSKEGAGAVAKYDSLTPSVTSIANRSSSALDGKYSEEKGGGRGEGGPEADASEAAVVISIAGAAGRAL